MVGIATTPTTTTLSIAGPGGGNLIPGVTTTATITTTTQAPTTTTTVHTDPTAAITGGPANGAVSPSASPTYSGTATGHGSGIDKVQVSVDGGSYSVTGVTCTGCGTASASWSFTPTSPLAEGSHTLAFRFARPGRQYLGQRHPDRDRRHRHADPGRQRLADRTAP